MDEQENANAWSPAKNATQGAIFHPPSAWIHWPLTYALASLARKRAMLAISDGSAKRPRGIEARRAAFRSAMASESQSSRPILVSVTPGATAFARIPDGPARKWRGGTRHAVGMAADGVQGVAD